MNLKLHQIIAIEKGIKSKAYAFLTELNKRAQKIDLFSGMTKRYTPKKDDDEVIPGEQKLIQLKAPEELKEMQHSLSEFFDLVLLKDKGNQSAKADLIVDGQVLLKDLPATYLLFLEKQLTDLRTYLGNLPRLDPSEEWKWDETKDCFVTQEKVSNSTKKVAKVITKAAATDKFPAQTEVVHEDVVVGTWTKIQMSAALSPGRARELSERIDKLLKAAKLARETANSTEVEKTEGTADILFGYLLK